MRILKVNSVLLAVLLSFLLPLRAEIRRGLTARDYYNELYTAGELDHVAGTYACFQDDPMVDSFFIFQDSKSLRNSLIATHAFGKLPEATQELLKKDLLMVRGYAKGIPWKGEEFLEKDEGSWISDQRMFDDNTPIQIRFTINWQTLRYKYAVEVLNMDSTYRSEVASFGHCEQVPAEAQARGEE